MSQGRVLGHRSQGDAGPRERSEHRLGVPTGPSVVEGRIGEVHRASAARRAARTEHQLGVRDGEAREVQISKQRDRHRRNVSPVDRLCARGDRRKLRVSGELPPVKGHRQVTKLLARGPLDEAEQAVNHGPTSDAWSAKTAIRA